MTAYEWKMYNGKHQSTIRIDSDTCKVLDVGFREINDLSKLVNAALKHYASCPLATDDKNGYEFRLQILEQRITMLEKQEIR